MSITVVQDSAPREMRNVAFRDPHETCTVLGVVWFSQTSEG